MKRLTARLLITLTTALSSFAAPRPSLAGSATWAPNPVSGDWNTAVNWTPNTIPNGRNDIATFGTSAIRALSIATTDIKLDSLVYTAGASAYTLALQTSNLVGNLTLSGAGIVNNSGIVQTFHLATFGTISFLRNATAGQMTSFSLNNGLLKFSDNASAGSASFDLTEGGSGYLATLSFNGNATAAAANVTVSQGMVSFSEFSTAGNSLIATTDGGILNFFNEAAADHAEITLSSGPAASGALLFFDDTSAGFAAVTANGAATAGAPASSISLADSSRGENAGFILNGGSVAGAAGAIMSLDGNATTGDATITVNGGSNGGAGAALIFTNTSAPADTGHIALLGNGSLQLGATVGGPTVIGSLEGDGLVLLNGNELSVGNANSSTIFSGSIQDGSRTGSTLSKVGTGTLTLSGASSYNGNTNLAAGVLIVSNDLGSATGLGPVTVNEGILGGGGTISGAVTVGTGNNSGAVLQPAFGTNKKVTLTIQNLLTFNSDATYRFALKSKSAELVAKGVTINSGAQFAVSAPGRKLPAGKTATVISNTSSTPIAGTFANLPDGGSITSGANTFKANYEGGDGNDLTLTVQ